MSARYAIVPRERLIEPPNPLRCEMGDQAMSYLVESIKQVGIIQPLAVVETWREADGTFSTFPQDIHIQQTPDNLFFEIVDGHRRYTATGIVGLDVLPVVVFADLGEAKFAVMLHANIMREDVTPFEEGVQFLELATKHNWSMEQLTSYFHRSEEYINTRAAIVTKDANVAEACRRREIGLGHALEILKCEDASFRPALLEQAAVHGATIAALKVMRKHHEDDLRISQGMLPVNASEQFVGAVLPPEECAWCGRTDDPGNLIALRVHNYHQKDLMAVLDQVGLRNLIKAAAGGDQ